MTVDRSSVYRIAVTSNSIVDRGIFLAVTFGMPDAKIQVTSAQRKPTMVLVPGLPLIWEFTVTPRSLGEKQVEVSVQTMRPPSRVVFTQNVPLDLTVQKDEPPYWSPSGRGGLAVTYGAAILGIISFPCVLFFGFVSLGGRRGLRRLFK